jgi:hypothetical protein
MAKTTPDRVMTIPKATRNGPGARSCCVLSFWKIAAMPQRQAGTTPPISNARVEVDMEGRS